MARGQTGKRFRLLGGTGGRGKRGVLAAPTAVAFVCALLAAALWLGAPAAQAAQESGTLTQMSADDFVAWLDGKSLAFVELFDPHCPYCRMAEPVLARLAQEMDLAIVKVDITQAENEWLARELRLEGTPTVWAFIDGRAVRPPLVGFLGEEGYRHAFEVIQEFAAQRQQQQREGSAES